MKKTLTINLSGIVFHIDEDAYEALNNYINKIKNNFSASEGRDEIIADIESRIAELFTSKISTSSQVITISHITEIIGIMGKPEDYIAEGATEQNTDSKEQQYTQQESTQRTKKRVFRDPDDRVFGGVCSGISAYFDIDPIFIRIAFAIAFFGYGTGLFLYILLLVIIPKARTTADKLEMRGEAVNIDSISKTIKEEVEQFKKTASGFKTELKNGVNTLNEEVNDFSSRMTKKSTPDKIKTGANKFADFLTQLFTSVFKVFGKVAVGAVVVISCIILFALLGILFSDNSININNGSEHLQTSFSYLASFIFNDKNLFVLAIVALVLLIGLPLISLIYSGIRFLFGVKHKTKIFNYITAILWSIGLIISFFVVMAIVKDFSAKAKESENYILNPTKSNTIYIKTKTNLISEDEKDTGALFEDDDFTFYINDNKLCLSRVELNVIPSLNDSFQLSISKLAQGSNKKEAIDRATKIDYSFTQNDSVLSLDYLLKLDEESKFRNQRIKLNLKVPEGKSVYFDKSAMRIIYDIENETNTLDSDMLNHTWMMRNKTLVCTDCKSKQPE